MLATMVTDRRIRKHESTMPLLSIHTSLSMCNISQIVDAFVFATHECKHLSLFVDVDVLAMAVLCCWLAVATVIVIVK